MLFQRTLFCILTLIPSIYCDAGGHCQTENCDNNESNDVEAVEGDIDNQLTGLAQDDPIVIEALKNYYLDKPNDFPRQLKGPLTPIKLQVVSKAIKCILQFVMHAHT